MQTRMSDFERKEQICTLASELPAFEKADVVVKLVDEVCREDVKLGHRLALDVHQYAVGAEKMRKLREVYRDVDFGRS